MTERESAFRPQKTNFGSHHQTANRVLAKKFDSPFDSKFWAVFEKAGNAFFFISHDRFVECNSVAEQMFGCNRNEILRRKIYDFSPPCQPDGRDSGESALEKLGKALSGEHQFFEWKHKRLDGSLLDAEVSLDRVVIDGEPLILAVVRDITKLKQTEYRLNERIKELDCLYNISRILERTDVSLDEICQEVLTLVCGSFQYPAVTGARITIDKKGYETRGFRRNSHKPRI